MNVEQKKIIVISASHLKEKTKTSFMVDKWESFMVAPFDQGFFVHIPPRSELDRDTPKEVRDVAKWLDKNFADERWVLFDYEADEVEGLPVYED